MPWHRLITSRGTILIRSTPNLKRVLWSKVGGPQYPKAVIKEVKKHVNTKACVCTECIHKPVARHKPVKPSTAKANYFGKSQPHEDLQALEFELRRTRQKLRIKEQEIEWYHTMEGFLASRA